MFICSDFKHHENGYQESIVHTANRRHFRGRGGPTFTPDLYSDLQIFLT